MAISISCADSIGIPASNYLYSTAGVEVHSDVELPLSPIRENSSPPLESGVPAPTTDPAWPGTRYSGWLAGAERGIRILPINLSLRLEIESLCTLTIDHENHIHLEKWNAEGNTDLLAEIVLGPALIICLARHGIWGLHASAVYGKGRVLAIAGDSGCGKSTLAARLCSKHGYTRISDDFLPLSICRGQSLAHADFPQFKFHNRCETSIAPSKISTIVNLSISSTGGFTVDTCNSSDGALSLIRNSVALRVMPPEYVINKPFV